MSFIEYRQLLLPNTDDIFINYLTGLASESMSFYKLPETHEIIIRESDDYGNLVEMQNNTQMKPWRLLKMIGIIMLFTQCLPI